MLSVHQKEKGLPLSHARMLRWMILVATLVSLFIGSFVLVSRQSNATSPQPATVSNPVPFGTNSGFEFVDLVKQGPRFSAIGANAPALTLDAQGWPQADFQYIFLDDRRNMPWDGPDFNGVHRTSEAGTYHLSFTGQATLTTQGAQDPNAVIFQNVAYNQTTNTTTADVVLLPNHWLGIIGFVNTKRQPGDTAGNGVTNIHLIRPGYPANTTQVFTTPFINALLQFHPTQLRNFSMGTVNYNIWNGTQTVTVTWDTRSLPTDAYWPNAAKNTGAVRALGVPWEYLIQLCNQINADPWIMVPVSADDNYITQLAKLFKNGDTVGGVTYPGLKAGLHVYVEYSNEVWNWSFSQATYNKIQADAEKISYEQRYLERLFQISDLFRGVYGDAAMGSTIRPVALWQYHTQLGMQQSLQWAEGKFGHPASYYIYGIGEAPYLDPVPRETAPYPDPADPNGVNRIIDSMYQNAGRRRQTFAQWETVASYFKIHEVGYEAGPSLRVGIETDATRSPRMADLIKRYFLEDYFATGADAVNFFSFGQGFPGTDGNWFTFEDYATANSYPKWLGVLGVAGQPRPPITVGNVLPWAVKSSVTIDASQHVQDSSNGPAYPAPGSVGCLGWNCAASADYLLRAPASGTYAIALTGKASNTTTAIQVSVDETVLGNVTLPVGQTPGSSSTISVTLTPGLHTLVLSAPTASGNSQFTLTPGGGITITLTSGGGSAVVPSAPINPIATVNNNQVSLQWENVTTATGYTIARSTTSGGPYTTIGTSATNSFTDTKVTNDTTYYYVITASNSAGQSAQLPQVMAVPTQPVAPATPTNITATSGGADPSPFNAGGQVRISWSAVPNATSYTILQYDPKSSTYKPVKTQTETVFYQSNLTLGTTYTYEIQASNSFGQSAPSAEIDLTPTEAVPSAPTNLTAVAGNGQVSLKWMQSQWQLPSFSFLFNIKRSTSPNGPFTTVQSISTNNAVDLSLTNGTQYCYVLTAVNSKGESTNSNVACATPKAGSGTPTPIPSPTVTATPTSGTFSTSFENGQPQPTWTNTVDSAYPGGGIQNVGGICCNLSGPEAGVRQEKAHTGKTALMYSGLATASSASATLKVFDLSSQAIAVDATTTLEYWINPRTNFGSTTIAANSTCVALDVVFSDGTTLRSSGAVDQNGNPATPAGQCTKLTDETWNHVIIKLGTKSAGKQIVRLDLSAQPSSTGGYRGYIDDISIHE